MHCNVVMVVVCYIFFPKYFAFQSLHYNAVCNLISNMTNSMFDELILQKLKTYINL